MNNNMHSNTSLIFQLFALACISLLYSCKSVYDPSKVSLQDIPPENMWAFPLDTITMNNPVVIQYKNVQYLLDMDVDSIPNNNIQEFLNYKFYYFYSEDLSPKQLWQVPLIRKCDDYLYEFGTELYTLYAKKNNYEIFCFEEKPVKFLLVAINSLFFSNVLSTIKEKRIIIDSASPMSRYIVVAFPIKL